MTPPAALTFIYIYNKIVSELHVCQEIPHHTLQTNTWIGLINVIHLVYAQTGKPGTIPESNQALGVCKGHYAENYV